MKLGREHIWDRASLTLKSPLCTLFLCESGGDAMDATAGMPLVQRGVFGVLLMHRRSCANQIQSLSLILQFLQQSLSFRDKYSQQFPSDPQSTDHKKQLVLQVQIKKSSKQAIIFKFKFHFQVFHYETWMKMYRHPLLSAELHRLK